MAKDKLIYASAARRAILREEPRLAYCIDNIKGVEAVEVVKSCEDENTQYLEFPDGLRLIFRNGKYDGWYVCK